MKVTSLRVPKHEWAEFQAAAKAMGWSTGSDVLREFVRAFNENPIGPRGER